MIDIFIVVFSTAGWIVYFVLQSIFIRYVPPVYRLSFSIRLQALMSVLLFFSLCVMAILEVMTVSTLVMVAVASQAIFHGLAIIYLLSVFSYFESSITIHLFTLIAKKGRKGISEKELMRHYGPKQIVQRRLDRFVSMRMLEKQGDQYMLRSRCNAFTIREFAANLMKIFFSPMEQQRNV